MGELVLWQLTKVSLSLNLEGRSALIGAAYYQKPDVVQLLLEYPGTTAAVDADGNTALHHAGLVSSNVLSACQ